MYEGVEWDWDSTTPQRGGLQKSNRKINNNGEGEEKDFTRRPGLGGSSKIKRETNLI